MGAVAAGIENENRSDWHIEKRHAGEAMDYKLRRSAVKRPENSDSDSRPVSLSRRRLSHVQFVR